MSLAFGIDESEFRTEALLLVRAIITAWRISRVTRLSQPSREQPFLSIDTREEVSVTGLRQMSPKRTDRTEEPDGHSQECAKLPGESSAAGGAGCKSRMVVDRASKCGWLKRASGT